MWELSLSHCCATCRFSRTPVCRFETVKRQNHGRLAGEAELFPFGQDLMCEYLQDNLEEDCVQAVLVKANSRCEAYECHLERYIASTGYAPREEENLYGFADEYSPVAARGLNSKFGMSLDF